MNRWTTGLTLGLSLPGAISCGNDREMNDDLERQYSLWMAPSGAQYEMLHSLVCDLAERYPSPCFMPHVTVVGEVTGSLDDVTRRAEVLAERTGALDARLTTIEWAKPEEYYRAFYLLVEETEPFTKLYDDTCEIMDKCHRRPYHISLMYTDQLSDPERNAIRDSLYETWGRSGLDTTVELDRLQICDTQGLLAEDWQCPIEIELR